MSSIRTGLCGAAPRQGNAEQVPCGLRSAGLGRSAALNFLPIAWLLPAKSALHPIPIRLPHIRQDLFSASLNTWKSVV